MSVNQLVLELKENNEDMEFYPSTPEMLEIISKDMHNLSDVLDIGCGTCNFKKYVKNIKNYYVIEKSKILLNKLDADTIVLGTDFYNTLLIDKKVDVIFCNPPYSDFENWASEIIWNGNCTYIYLIIPERWKNSEKIQKSIENSNSRASILGSFDFLSAERSARAKVDIVKIDKRPYSEHYGFYDKELKDFNEKAFDKWFDDTFKMRNSGLENLYENTINARKDEKIKNQLVNSNSKAKMLVDFYNEEQKTLFEHFKAISTLDVDILKTIGIEKNAVKEALKQKVKTLKVRFWQLVFNEMEEITSRLTFKTRKKMMDKFKNLLTVDFNLENIYPLILWVIKNSNDYYNEQLLDFFGYLTTPDNIQNYKSNQKVFKRKEYWPEYFENKDEVSHYILSYRIICKILKHSENGFGDYGYYNWTIYDVCTIANNLGFIVDTSSIVKKIEYGKKEEVLYKNGKVFMTYRCYKNGNMHIKFEKEFMKAMNVEASRLLKWVETAEDVKKEFPSEYKGAEKYFKVNKYISLENNGIKLLGVNNEH